MAINAAVCSSLFDSDGKESRYQLATGNGAYYLYDTEINEVLSEITGEQLSTLAEYEEIMHPDQAGAEAVADDGIPT